MSNCPPTRNNRSAARLRARNRLELGYKSLITTPLRDMAGIYALPSGVVRILLLLLLFLLYFKKAFDSVHHQLLWYKLSTIGVSTNFLRLLIDIYTNAQSCIQLNGKYTDSFLCSIGVRQGCPLSPILFTLFTHDLLVEIRKVCGIKLGHRKVSGLMFADDLVLLADNPQDLQAGLNALQEYCSKWALTVNHNKTKVLIFGRFGSPSTFVWSYNGTSLEQVLSYRYLGIIFSNTGSFATAVKTLCQSALKVINRIETMSREQGGFSPDVMCSLFSALVQPILEYGCEIWGVTYHQIIEKVLLKFCKGMLGLPPNASTIAVYGETGTFPQWLRIYYRVIKYYVRIHVSSPPLVFEALTVLKTLPTKKRNWNTSVSQTIMKYTNTQSINASQISMTDIKKNLQDSYIATWREQLWNDIRQSGRNKLRTYRLFKTVFAWEFYLSRITKRSHMIAMARFRTSCHSLAIETGRYTIPPTPPEHRLCTYCTSGKIDDELHFITECCHLDNYRRSLYNTAMQYNTEFNSLSNMRKMCYLFETNNTPTIRKLGWYIFSCFEFRKSVRL